MPNSRDAKGELLAAISWDVRASAEAQLRALTAMQRCVEDFQKTADRDALGGVRKHLSEVDERAAQLRESLRLAREALAALEASVA